MSRFPDPDLRAAWQRRLRAFDAHRGTVQQFCAQQGVSTAAFYQWRRKLAAQHPRAVPRTGKAVVSDREPPRFVPLTLVSDDAANSRSSITSIHLAGGTRVEVAGDDLELIQTILQSVMLHDASLIGELPASVARQGGAR
jgi:transposase-like protein